MITISIYQPDEDPIVADEAISFAEMSRLLGRAASVLLRCRPGLASAGRRTSFVFESVQNPALAEHIGAKSFDSGKSAESSGCLAPQRIRSAISVWSVSMRTQRARRDSTPSLGSRAHCGSRRFGSMSQSAFRHGAVRRAPFLPREGCTARDENIRDAETT